MVVADDSVLLREGLVRLLTEVDTEVVAAVDDAPSFLRAVSEHRPDVAIVDVRMPPGMTDDGLRAAVEARASQPDLGILMLSAYVELSYADVLLSDGRGRVGYLLKDRVTSLDTLVDALRTISAGGTVLDPEVVAQLLVARRRTDPLGTLSPRERDVLALMAEGRSNAAIAERLVVTGGAVEKHVSNIFAKINLPDVGSDNRRVLAVLAWLRARYLAVGRGSQTLVWRTWPRSASRSRSATESSRSATRTGSTSPRAGRPSSTWLATTSRSPTASSTRSASGPACCTASRRGGRREGAPEAAAARRAAVGRDRAGALPALQPRRRRALRDRAGRRDLGGADVDGRVPPLELPARRHREARRVADRPRPDAGSDLRRRPAGRR